jgi:hypothetical protein
VQERARAAADSEASARALLDQLHSGRIDIEARFNELRSREAALADNAAGLRGLEATLAALGSSATATAAREADILADLHNTLRSERDEAAHEAAIVSKATMRVRFGLDGDDRICPGIYCSY